MQYIISSPEGNMCYVYKCVCGCIMRDVNNAKCNSKCGALCNLCLSRSCMVS